MLDPKKKHMAVFGLVVIVALGLGSLGLTFQTFSARLSAPFHLLPARDINSFSIATDFSEQLETQTKDTDKDGLPDIQELQIYKTSPFLEDSDSDGILDKEEIARGTDPNCPEGTDCRKNYFSDARDVKQEQIIKGLYESSVASKIAGAGIPGLTDAPAIRNFLKQAGIADEVVNQFSDAELREIFDEAARGAPPQSSPQSGEEVQGGSLPKNPTPQEIRELLLGAGIDKTMLSAFTDEQLVELYQSALKDMNK